MRKNIILFINGVQHILEAEHALMTVAEYLRYIKGLTGTKIVCSEGDCGACTILVSRFVGDKFTPYESLNSCIGKMHQMDRCHLITVEGVGTSKSLHPVQEAMVKCHGAQCGYCTPGIVCALASLADDLKITGKPKTEQKVKNYLSGNLCRCTGYEPIIKAGMEIDIDAHETFSTKFNDHEMKEYFLRHDTEVLFQSEEKEVFIPSTMEEAAKYKDENNEAIILSGGTDLGVVENKGRLKVQKALSLNNITDAYLVNQNSDFIEFGAKTSLEEVEKACEKDFSEFSNLIHIFASPQIKNGGTLVGNLVNASPIADTTPFLRVAEAEIDLISNQSSRTININKFIKGGYKELDLEKNELVSKIRIPKTSHNFKLYKTSVRKDLDISIVTFACRYKIENNKIEDISIAYGGVGPIVYRLEKLEAMMKGQDFNQSNFLEFAETVQNEVTPMSDHRGSKKYRYKLCRNLLLKFYDEVNSELSNSKQGASL